jgi:hypothetical protein
LGLASLLSLLAACSPQSMLVRGVADQLASQGTAPEDDPVLAREAGAFYLKFSESVLTQQPGHLRLAESVTAGFTQYAYAFVVSDADRLETTDAKAAQRLRQRAARLYERGWRHAMNALEQHRPGLRRFLTSPDALPAAGRPRLSDDELGLVYWASAAWGGYISLSKDRPDVVADLPQAVALARLAWDRNPDYGEGALASLMGSYEMARPGGTRRQAEAYFERAIAAGGGRHAGPYVAKAEALALPAGDRTAFESLLHQALLAGALRRDLANVVMQERAQWLLDTADDHF